MRRHVRPMQAASGAAVRRPRPTSVVRHGYEGANAAAPAVEGDTSESV